MAPSQNETRKLIKFYRLNKMGCIWGILTDYGSPLEIIKQFGSKAKYLEAVKELEQ